MNKIVDHADKLARVLNDVFSLPENERNAVLLVAAENVNKSAAVAMLHQPLDRSKDGWGS